MLTLGEKLRRMRLKQNLTLVQLAGLTKVSAVTIHNIERDIYEPKISTLMDLSKALNAPLKHFIDPGPEGLFMRQQDDGSSTGYPRRLKSRNLPHLKRIELQADSELTLKPDPGCLLVIHLIFGRIEAVNGKRSIQLLPGDNLYVELFEETILTARENSLGVLVNYPSPARSAD